MIELKKEFTLRNLLFKGHLIFIMLFIGLACHAKTDQQDNNSSEEIVENEILNPFIIFTRSGTKMVEAKSEKLIKRQDQFAFLIDNVIIDFYNDEGNHISTLYSDSAKINEQNNDLQANGNVYVVSDSGYTLITEKIIWDNNYKMIIAEDSVMFTTLDRDTLYGVGFESDADLEEWRIFKPFGIAREGF